MSLNTAWRPMASNRYLLPCSSRHLRTVHAFAPRATREDVEEPLDRHQRHIKRPWRSFWAQWLLRSHHRQLPGVTVSTSIPDTEAEFPLPIPTSNVSRDGLDMRCALEFGQINSPAGGLK